MRLLWSIEKNNQLKAHPDRGICFEDIVAAIDQGGLLDDVAHPNTDRYPGQRVLVVFCNGYVYAVPYVQQGDGTLFLKTAFPSRILKKQYMNGDDDGKES